MKINKHDTILFQGDSITDAGRERPKMNPPQLRNNIHHLGAGYAAKTAAMLLAANPALDLTFHNRGISGNRVTNMRDRWQADCLDLKPTILSILIGVNDTWHGVASGTPENGVGVEEFDRVLRDLIAATKKALPGIRIIICEPFTTEAGAVLRMNFHPDIDERRAKVKAIASEMADVYVPFQTMFDDLCKIAPPDYWAGDGVHPSPAGHQKMAEFWIKCVTGK
jgi:lysophospholipase L1-like esterase